MIKKHAHKITAFVLASLLSVAPSLQANTESVSAVAPAVFEITKGGSRDPEIDGLLRKIRQSENLEDAVELALEPTEAAIDALQRARIIMPFSKNLRSAQVRLADARSRIETAETPDQVADEFSGMMVAWLDDNQAAHVGVAGKGCSYSTGEVIAIVVGLILGIIPGIILLIVLC
ncbi:MAG: hypothetical protein ACU826_05755 [Gammaproteobacteria bacterium]